MITQIEIDGFKTFKDFKVELAPFQVIVGPNGSGKSNLFDALQLVSQLMIPGNDVYKAMQGIRGEAGELFTKYPDGTTSDTIRIAVEMLVDKKASFSKKNGADLKFTRFRYELKIRIEQNKKDLYQEYKEEQHLKTIPSSHDNWCKKHNILPNHNVDQQDVVIMDSALVNFRKSKGLTRENIEEEIKNLEEQNGLLKEQDRLIDDVINNYSTNLPENGEPLLRTKNMLIQRIRQYTQRLSELNRALEYKYDMHDVYVSTVQQELLSLSFYHFNPEALRKRSSTSAPRYLAPDGSNLPSTLARIKAEDPVAFQFISHDITSLVSDVLSIDVEKYDAIGEYGIRVTTSDKRTFTAQALSDGTLRLLALATLRNDPQFHGTICIEEPENGVQPLYLNEFARLLHDMTTDFTDPERADEPLRQVIATTHSPLFISQPEVIDHLLLATTPTIVAPQETQPFLQVTRMDPVITPETLATMNSDTDEDLAGKHYTIDIVRQYLNGDTLQQADERLKQARSNIRKKR